MKKRLPAACLALAVSLPCQGSSLWDKTKEVGQSAVDIVSDTASSVESAVTGDEASPETARKELDGMAAATLERLFKKSPGARESLENAPAYAVFDTRKMSFLITTGFGSGVAVEKGSGRRVYMKMAAGGVNLGAGAQLYQVVFVFPTKAVFERFITEGWDAGADADAAAGKDAENLALRLPDGTLVYKLNEAGVMLSATLTGTRYWQWEELNAGR